MTSNVDHLRDFFVIITRDNNGSGSQKIAMMKDGETEWADLLPFSDPTLVVDEFDSFDSFFAIYCQKDGVPQIVVQDLETNTF